MSANRPLTYTGTVKVATVQAESVIMDADASGRERAPSK
jgi:hypothetical protein